MVQGTIGTVHDSPLQLIRRPLDSLVSPVSPSPSSLFRYTRNPKRIKQRIGCCCHNVPRAAVCDPLAPPKLDVFLVLPLTKHALLTVLCLWGVRDVRDDAETKT